MSVGAVCPILHQCSRALGSAPRPGGLSCVSASGSLSRTQGHFSDVNVVDVVFKNANFTLKILCSLLLTC